MALLIPANVLVVKGVLKRMTRFVVDYPSFDGTTKVTVVDQNDPAKQYEFTVVGLAPVPEMADKVLVTMQTTRLPRQGRTFQTADLRVVAKTTGVADGVAVVAAMVLNKQYHVVDMSKLPPNQVMSRKQDITSTLILPVKGKKNYVTASVSATYGKWEVFKAVQRGTTLELSLKCLDPTYRSDLSLPAVPLTDGTSTMTVTMTSEDDHEEELPPAEVVFGPP